MAEHDLSPSPLEDRLRRHLRAAGDEVAFDGPSAGEVSRRGRRRRTTRRAAAVVGTLAAATVTVVAVAALRGGDAGGGSGIVDQPVDPVTTTPEAPTTTPEPPTSTPTTNGPTVVVEETPDAVPQVVPWQGGFLRVARDVRPADGSSSVAILRLSISTDGLSWTDVSELELPSGPGAPIAEVASDGGTFVAVTDVAVATTTDLAAWDQVVAFPTVSSDPASSETAQLFDPMIDVAGGRVLVTLSESSGPSSRGRAFTVEPDGTLTSWALPDGLRPTSVLVSSDGQLYVAAVEDSLGDGPVSLWASSDGSSWDQRTVPSVLAPLRQQPIEVGGALVVMSDVSTGDGLPLWSSADGGRTWQPATAVVGVPGPDPDVVTQLSVLGDGNGERAVLQVSWIVPNPDSVAPEQTSVVITSTDGTTWELLDTLERGDDGVPPIAAGVFDLAVTGDRVLILRVFDGVPPTVEYRSYQVR